MKRKSAHKGVRRIAAVLCAGFLLPYTIRAGQIQDRLDETGKNIDRLEDGADKTQSSIEAYEKEQRELQADIFDRQETIRALSEELDETRSQLSETRGEIKETQAALQESKAAKEKQYEQMKKRICFMYENSTEDILVYILEAGTLADVLRRAAYFEAVMDYDREKLDEYRGIIKKIKKEKEALVSEKEALASLEEAQEQKLAQIDAALTALKSRLRENMAQLQDSKEKREWYAAEIRRQKAYEAELEKQKAEEDRRLREQIQKQEEARREQERQERERQEKEQAQKEQEQKEQGQKEQEQEEPQGDWQRQGSDLELLSTIIYCEAGSEPYEGQLAVGSVVMNRVASASFPNSISGVIYQSGQFSPVASGRFAQALAAGSGSRCRSAAQAVLNGTRTVSCLFFHRNNGTTDGIVIGNHVFY